MKAGYTVETERVGPPESPEWQLSLASWARVTLDEIHAQRAFLEDLVDDYDGWLVTSLYADDDDEWDERQASRIEAATGPVLMPLRPVQAPAPLVATPSAAKTERAAPRPRPVRVVSLSENDSQTTQLLPREGSRPASMQTNPPRRH